MSDITGKQGTLFYIIYKEHGSMGMKLGIAGRKILRTEVEKNQNAGSDSFRKSLFSSPMVSGVQIWTNLEFSSTKIILFVFSFFFCLPIIWWSHTHTQILDLKSQRFNDKNIQLVIFWLRVSVTPPHTYFTL